MPRAARSLALALVLAGCAGGGPGDLPTTTLDGRPERIPISVKKPEGKGPFPAVVVMHDCSGLSEKSSGAPERWSKLLLDAGYAVAIPDSFRTRGFPFGVCTDPSPSRVDVGPLRRVRDARAALAYLRTLPYVDEKRIGLMGGSHGGSTTVLAVNTPKSDFAAAIAFYPGCPRKPVGAPTSTPLLILTGEKDDWTPAEPCRRFADAAATAGQPVSIRIYPGAQHAFDSPNPVRYVPSRVNMNAPGRRGATTGGNAEAWADSIRQVTGFFAKYLKP